MANRLRRQRQPWWTSWWPGRAVEALLIALLIEGLMALTLIAAYHAYLAGLTALSRPGQPTRWLIAPGEVGLVLLLGLVGGGWLAGSWLGERLRRDWLAPGLLAAGATLPLTLWLFDALAVAGQPERFAIGGLATHLLWLLGPALMTGGILLGGLAGAWWASLAEGAE